MTDRPTLHPVGVTDPEELHRIRIAAFEATATDTFGAAVAEEMRRLRARIAELEARVAELELEAMGDLP